MGTVSKLIRAAAALGVSAVFAAIGASGGSAQASTQAHAIGNVLDPCFPRVLLQERNAVLAQAGARVRDESGGARSGGVVRARVTRPWASDSGFGCPIEHTRI